MPRPHSSEVCDLLAAGRPGGYQHVAGLEGARRGQQAALTDLARDVVVLTRVAERSGHAAAAGVEVSDARSGNALEKRPGRRQRAQRLLMAMAVEEYVRGAGLEGQRDRSVSHTALDVFLEQEARVGHLPRLSLIVAAQQRRHVLPQRGETARLEKQQRMSGADVRVEQTRVLRGEDARLLQEPLRNQRPPAADVRREAYRHTGGVEHVGRSQADL